MAVRSVSKRAQYLVNKLEALEDDSINLYIQFGERAVWPLYKALRIVANDILAWQADQDNAIYYQSYGNKLQELGPVLRYLQSVMFETENSYPGFKVAEQRILDVSQAANAELNVSDLMM